MLTSSKKLNWAGAVPPTRERTQTYFFKLLEVGAHIPQASIASQALARFECEKVPPNPCQQKALAICQEALIAANLGHLSPATGVSTQV